MELTITIKGKFPDLNLIITTAKWHWGEYKEMKQLHTDAVTWQVKRHPQVGRVHITFTWYCKDRRTDPDNVAAGKKFVLDGLVEAGVLKGDGWKYIAGFEDKFDIGEPRVELVMREVE